MSGAAPPRLPTAHLPHPERSSGGAYPSPPAETSGRLPPGRRAPPPECAKPRKAHLRHTASAKSLRPPPHCFCGSCLAGLENKAGRLAAFCVHAPPRHESPIRAMPAWPVMGWPSGIAHGNASAACDRMPFGFNTKVFKENAALRVYNEQQEERTATGIKRWPDEVL